jgi:hypothetical protein
MIGTRPVGRIDICLIIVDRRSRSNRSTTPAQARDDKSKLTHNLCMGLAVSYGAAWAHPDALVEWIEHEGAPQLQILGADLTHRLGTGRDSRRAVGQVASLPEQPSLPLHLNRLLSRG